MKTYLITYDYTTAEDQITVSTTSILRRAHFTNKLPTMFVAVFAVWALIATSCLAVPIKLMRRIDMPVAAFEEMSDAGKAVAKEIFQWVALTGSDGARAAHPNLEADVPKLKAMVQMARSDGPDALKAQQLLQWFGDEVTEWETTHPEHKDAAEQVLNNLKAAQGSSGNSFVQVEGIDDAILGNTGGCDRRQVLKQKYTTGKVAIKIALGLGDAKGEKRAASACTGDALTKGTRSLEDLD